MHQESDQYEKATLDFSAAVAMDPQNPTAWGGLGVGYMYMEHVKPGGNVSSSQTSLPASKESILYAFSRGGFWIGNVKLSSIPPGGDFSSPRYAVSMLRASEPHRVLSA